MAELSLIIVNWNVEEYLRKCLNSIFDHPPKTDFEIIVVDNASTDNSVKMIKEEFPLVKLIANAENVGFSKANNQGYAISSGKKIFFLNPDTIVPKGSIEELMNFLNNAPSASAVAPKLLYPDGTLQPSVLRFPTISAMFVRTIFVEGLWPNNPITRSYLMHDFDYNSAIEIDQPMGAAIMVKRDILEKVGLFDEASFMFFDEVDLCYRIKKAGYKIFFTPSAQIIHHLSKSVNKWGVMNLSKNWTKSRNHFFRKHYGVLALALLYLFDFLRVIIICALILGLLFLVSPIAKPITGLLK
jgi:GT2 family glycosyltransferase